jgi:hypothetical protein
MQDFLIALALLTSALNAIAAPKEATSSGSPLSVYRLRQVESGSPSTYNRLHNGLLRVKRTISIIPNSPA